MTPSDLAQEITNPSSSVRPWTLIGPGQDI
jgi:hypothetical protein